MASKNESSRDFHNVAKDVPFLLSKNHVSACTGKIGPPGFLLFASSVAADRFVI
jgi:hypothetical protein